MNYVDTHCHIDRFDEPLAVLERAEKAGVVTVAVTEIPSDYQRLALRLGKRRLVRVALGLHPLRAGAISPMELALFARLLDRAEYVGEVGLDRSPAGRENFRSQVRIFEHLLQQPRIRHKILTVHSRGAEQETIERLSQAGIPAILHWYSGPLKHIDAALQAGIWFSVNPAMLRSKNGQRIIAALPRGRVLTETDGPYTKMSGHPSEPRDIPDVVARLAAVWKEEPWQAQERVFQNMKLVAAAARDTAAI